MDNENNILEYLKKIDKRLEKVEEKLLDKNPSLLEETKNLPNQREKSLVECYKEYTSKNETDKTLVIMDCLEKIKSAENITSKDIFHTFKEVRERPPTNISDKIQMLNKRGLIMFGENVNKMKGWVITQTGLNYLEELKNE